MPFYNECITAFPVPVDMRAPRALKLSVGICYQLNFKPNCMARGSVCTFVIFPNWQPN